MKFTNSRNVKRKLFKVFGEISRHRASREACLMHSWQHMKNLFCRGAGSVEQLMFGYFFNA